MGGSGYQSFQDLQGIYEGLENTEEVLEAECDVQLHAGTVGWFHARDERRDSEHDNDVGSCGGRVEENVQENKIQQEYRKLYDMANKIPFVGKLNANHLLGLMALSGVIPPRLFENEFNGAEVREFKYYLSRC